MLLSLRTSRVTTDADGRLAVQHPGEPVEVDDAAAELMLERGHAVRVEAAPTTAAAKRSTRTRGADRETR